MDYRELALITVRQAMLFLLRGLEIVETFHDIGHVHGDVKADNLMITEDSVGENFGEN